MISVCFLLVGQPADLIYFSKIRMATKSPTLLLIAGPNGAGKTTFAGEILTRELKGMRFLNVDEIARGLSPFDPSVVAFKAGRLLLEEARGLIDNTQSFALETTLSGKGYVNLIKRAKEAGYQVVLHFLWLPSPQESIHRVRQRVIKGGHHVSVKDIRRRYPRISHNLIHLYMPLVNRWYFWDAHAPAFTALANHQSHAIFDIAHFLEIK